MKAVDLGNLLATHGTGNVFVKTKQAVSGALLRVELRGRNRTLGRMGSYWAVIQTENCTLDIHIAQVVSAEKLNTTIPKRD